MITYDDFSKLDIAIGTITHAEIVADADKLLKLVVDVGEEEPRQIISGIREFYEPEDLLDRQCPFVVNLEPRTIRGLESNGMILAGRSEAKLALLHPNTYVPPGTRIS